MANIVEYKNKVFYFLFFSFSYLLGFLLDNIFLSVFINQLVLLYIILFIYSYNIWSLTSQFNLYNLLYQVLPGLINFELYFLHTVIILTMQLTTLIAIRKINIRTPFNTLKKIEKIKNFQFRFVILLSLLILSHLINTFHFALEVQFAACALLTYLIVTNRKNAYIDLIFVITLLFFTYNVGFLGGDRRFLIFFMLILFLFIMHRYNFKLSNFFFVTMIPIGMLIFFFQGLYRTFGFQGAYERFLLLKYTSLYNFFENIDIGVFNRIYEAMFSKELYSYIRDSYLTGMSFERFTYLWIPREFWNEKPHNLATVAGEYAYAGNSAPISLPLEIYVNFGIWLCPFIFLFLSKIFLYLDNSYHQSNKKLVAYYFFLVSFFVVIYRGSIETDLVIFSIFFLSVYFFYELFTWAIVRKMKT